MSLGRGLLAFAGGFGQGFMQGKQQQHKQKQEDERHALEMKRLEMENARLQDEQSMRQELKTLNDVSEKPSQAFVVQNANGRTVYTDEAMAKAHAANDPSSQVVPAFVVGGQTYSDKHEAEQAAARQSTPAAKLAREAAIYKKYGRNDMAAGAYALYQKELETNRQMLQQGFLDAQSRGDIKAAVDLYNQNILNGATADVKQGPNGEIVVTRTRAGQPIGQPQVFKSPDDFWAKTQELVAKAPANLFEAVKFDKEFGLRERGVRVQEGQLANDTTRTGAQVQHLQAQTADIPLAAQDRRQQVQNNTSLTGAQVGHLGAQTADIPNAAADRHLGALATQTNAQTARLGLTKPSVSAVPDAKGGLNFVVPTVTVDQQGNYTLGAPQVQAAPGLQYPAGYVAQQRNSLGGLDLGGPATPQLDPNAIKNVMTLMQQEADRRKAARGQNAAPAKPAAKSDLVAPRTTVPSTAVPPDLIAPPGAVPPALPAGAAVPPDLIAPPTGNGLHIGDALAAFGHTVRDKLSGLLHPNAPAPVAPLGPRSASGPVTPMPAPAAKPRKLSRGPQADIHILHDLVMQQESGGHRYDSKGRLLQSGAGAKGEMQVMDATNSNPGYGVVPARNNSPEERARVGRDYLAAMVRKFGNVPMALAAYNAGPGAVQKAVKKARGGDWLTLLPEETENYVADIMDEYRKVNRPQA